MKHTPGPWEIKREHMLDWHILCKSNIPNIPGIVARVGFKPNAILIATAPELLEACKKAKRYLQKYKELGTIYADGIMALNECKQAIKKAEGTHE